MSSTQIAPRFERWVGQASNLDRCTRCGRPRSVHDEDETCPRGMSVPAAVAVMIAGVTLAAGGIVLRLMPVPVSHQVPACIFLVGVVLLVAGLSVLGQYS